MESLLALEGLIAHIAAQPNVWFARCADVAEAMRSTLKGEIQTATVHP